MSLLDGQTRFTEDGIAVDRDLRDREPTLTPVTDVFLIHTNPSQRYLLTTIAAATATPRPPRSRRWASPTGSWHAELAHEARRLRGRLGRPVVDDRRAPTGLLLLG